MITRNLLKLIEHEEKSIVGLLLSKEYIKLKKDKKGYNFDNVQIEDKGLKIVGTENLISDKYIRSLRDFFPPYFKGNMKSVRDKLERFLDTYDYSLDQIYKAFELWNNMKQAPYCGKADNFIFLRKDGTEISRLQEVLEEMTQEDTKESDLNLL